MAMKHYLLPLISYMNHVSWLWLCQNYGSFKNHGSRKMIAEFHWPSSLVLFSCYVHLTFSIFFFTKLSVLTSLFSNKCLSSPLLVSESQKNIYILKQASKQKFQEDNKKKNEWRGKEKYRSAEREKWWKKALKFPPRQQFIGSARYNIWMHLFIYTYKTLFDTLVTSKRKHFIQRDFKWPLYFLLAREFSLSIINLTFYIRLPLAMYPSTKAIPEQCSTRWVARVFLKLCGLCGNLFH